MLHWRRKSALKRHKLWAKLVACSFGMHLIFLIVLFVGYKDSIKLIFSMSTQTVPKHNAPVTLVAFSSVDNKAEIVQGWQQKKPASTVTKSMADKNKKIIPQKKSVTKPVTKVAEQKKNPVKKPAPKKVVAHTKPKPEPKKFVQAKPEPQKKLAENKKEEVNATQQLVQSTQTAQPIELNTALTDQYMMEQFAQLQQELTRHWQPPVGIAKECACEITAQIDRQGNIEDIKIETPSGVLMFDVAARTAMLAMELPRWTWGKSLSITFKP